MRKKQHRKYKWTFPQNSNRIRASLGFWEAVGIEENVLLASGSAELLLRRKAAKGP